jgi:hypothetical protein
VHAGTSLTRRHSSFLFPIFFFDPGHFFLFLPFSFFSPLPHWLHQCSNVGFPTYTVLAQGGGPNRPIQPIYHIGGPTNIDTIVVVVAVHSYQAIGPHAAGGGLSFGLGFRNQPLSPPVHVYYTVVHVVVSGPLDTERTNERTNERTMTNNEQAARTTNPLCNSAATAAQNQATAMRTHREKAMGGNGKK